MPKLYVISGHGAGDPGSVGNGYNEANVVRQISSRLKALGGSSVVELDKNIDWYKAGRVDSALKNLVGSNPVIELHLDAASASAKGGHVIISSNKVSDKYDNALANFIKDYFPGRSTIISKRSDLANPKRAYAQGINYRLLECCFITNSADMTKLMSDMDTFCRGILNCFGIAQAGWIKDAKGWWYRYADGTYPKAKWLKLDAWYYFDDRGYALASTWKKINGYWYYFGSDCRMKTGWQTINGKKYYLHPSKDGNWPEGSAHIGWQRVSNKWYYFNSKSEGTECSMRTGWLTTKDGKKYYLQPDKDGAMAEAETIYVEGKRCQFNKNGHLV